MLHLLSVEPPASCSAEKVLNFQVQHRPPRSVAVGRGPAPTPGCRVVAQELLWPTAPGSG